MTPVITTTELAGTATSPPLVLGPSLGTSAEALWSGCARHLGEHFHVVGWDLPGHGRSASMRGELTMAELAAAVHDAVTADGRWPAYFYAGDSVGGAVGIQLLLDQPGALTAAALVCTGAKIGDARSWRDRAATVLEHGTEAVVDGSAARWFVPGFPEREPEVANRLLDALRAADRDGYAAVCTALSTFDTRERLPEITAPVLAIAGSDDVATPPALLEDLANGVPNGRLEVLPHVAHLAPAEAPGAVASLLMNVFQRTASR